jgi:streptogramin lyase
MAAAAAYLALAIVERPGRNRFHMRILTITILLFAALAATASARPFPETIPLPNGWQPEGIATGKGNSFYAGSRATGSIYRGDLRTGEGSVLVQREGSAALGMKVARHHRLFVAGGGTGTATVYDARDGEQLRSYALTSATSFVNDVTVTRRAAYFTDSLQQQLYVLDLGRGGALPAQSRTLPLTGDLQYDADPGTFELNGIAATPNGKRLIAVQSHTGKLFLIDPRSGDTDEIELEGGDGDVVQGDGILLAGRTLYVVQNRMNRIAVVRLGRGLETGEITRTITDTDFDVPTTIARKGRHLWAVNARFNTPPTPDTEYRVVRVRR